MKYRGFEIPENTSVVTSSYVVDEMMPIVYVSHEYDEEEGDVWQFHCGNGDFDMSKMLLVSLGNILSIDSSLSEVSDLPVDSVARRSYVGDKWTYSTE